MILEKLDFNVDHNLLIDEFISNKSLQSRLVKDNQISLQYRPGAENDLQLTESVGSLVYDWVGWKPTDNKKPKIKDNILEESIFNKTCDIFVPTYMGQVIDELSQKYSCVRGRLMLMKPRSALTWHIDFTKRIHIPLITNDECFMVVNKEVLHLPIGDTYLVDTTFPHTAVNASVKNRYHMVFCIK